ASVRKDWKSAYPSYPTSGRASNLPPRMLQAPHRWATERKRRLASQWAEREPLALARVAVNSAILTALFQEVSAALVLDSAHNALSNSPVAVPPHQRSSRSSN